MPKNKLLIPDHSEGEELLEQIHVLEQELAGIQQKTREFEVVLHNHVGDLFVEAQELFVLYNQIKKAKKANRLEQKKRGKNYKEPKGLQITSKPKKSVVPSEDQKEKKRLYREAILHVHPDKFYLNQEGTVTATEITSKLIEIYKNDTLEALQAYHTHIFKGNTSIELTDNASKIQFSSKDNYLELKKEQIKKEIEAAKNNHLYKVITENENPLTFVDEVKAYYKDRIFKLKKRTRKGIT